MMSQDSRAFPRIDLLSREQCEAIHHASLEILRRTGVRVYHTEALDLLRETDAVITDDNLVRMPPGLVEWAVNQAPSRIALCRRGGSEVSARLEGMDVSFGPGSDCPNYLDPRTGQHRPFSSTDVIDCIRVVDALPELQFVMSMGIPSDIGQASPYRHQAALMLEHTAKPMVFVCDDRHDCEAIAAMAASAAGGMTSLRLNPTLLLYSEPSTPLRHSDTATGKLLYMAEAGLPILHSPAPMMGGTAPVTLVGALALGNAEVLSSLVMHQLKRAGAPFVYGLAGIRLGYAIADPDVLAPMLKVKEPFAVNRLAQAASIAALQDEAFLRKSASANHAGRLLLYREFERLGLFYVKSHTNFVLVRVGPQAGAAVPEMLKRGVIVRPCTGYDLPEFLRITVGTAEQNARLIETLEHVLRVADAPVPA